MKSVNGIVLMVIGVFLLWIGVTGRFPALIQAIGLVRGSNPNQSNTGAKSSATNDSKSGSTPSTSDRNFDGIRLSQSSKDWLSSFSDSLNTPQSEVWRQAVANFNSPNHGDSTNVNN